MRSAYLRQTKSTISLNFTLILRRRDGLSVMSSPTKMPFLTVYLIVIIALNYQLDAVTCEQETLNVLAEEEQYTEWEYEPRQWTFDEGSEMKNNDFDSSFETSSDELAEAEEINNYNSEHSAENPHKRHHFLRQEVELRDTGQEEGQRECDQFRVDTREAIICDKKECEKFDFEWPGYNNQLTLIETTRHGMRFHRADFAFSQERRSSVSSQGTGDYQERKSIDINIFDLFKPKPTTTSTTFAPTQSISTTQNPDRQQDDSSTEKPVDINEAADRNTSQLVTTFRLDTRRRKQKIIGFGGALSDSTCRNIKSLSPQMAKSLMEDYYGDRGLKYNIVRMTMGSSDFSTTPYTNNDRQEPQTRQVMDDVEMNNFRLTEEDYEYKLPIARQAIATSRHELKFFSSLWSPPIWMKNNSHIVHGYLKGDVYGPYYKALAELMVKWFEAYRKNGIEFWATTGLNEPVTGVKPFIFHNSLGMTREDYVLFFKLYFGPMMRQRGFHNVKLMMLDDNKGYAPKWVREMLEDKAAAKYISGIAFHWYMNDEYENLDFLPKLYPDKFILATEACNGFLPFQVHALPGNWDRGVAYMYDILRMLQKNSAGWVDWNMALDLTGGPSWAKNNLDAAIIVNSARDEYYRSPMFYAMGHFSRFVEPDSYRLDYRLANAKFDYPLEAVGFITPKNYIVVVVLNANRHGVPFKVIVDRKVVRVVNLRSESFNTIIFKWKDAYP